MTILTINPKNKTMHNYAPFCSDEIAITEEVIAIVASVYKLRAKTLKEFQGQMIGNGFVFLNPLETINFMHVYANEDGTFAYTTYDIEKTALLAKQSNIDVIKMLRNNHAQYFRSLAIAQSFVKGAIEFMDGKLEKHSVECFEKEIVLLQLEETVLVYCSNTR